MKNQTIRWGLLGAGEILNRWMKGARQVEDMEIAAVASRTRERAVKMAEKFGIPEAASYEELLARPDIDIVYIPVPHTAHKELAQKAMKAGKAVLVEKPAGINAAEFEEMAACARKQKVFLMEAVWTKFFPAMEELKKILADGTIGEVRMLQSSFCFRTEDTAGSRLFDPARAGGSLLDVGVYNLHFAKMVMGRNPVKFTGLASIDTDKLHLMVDEQTVCTAQYENGALAMMSSAVRTNTEDTAYIYGTKGYIVIPHFWKPEELQIHRDGKTRVIKRKVQQRIPGAEDEGYQYEIRHVNQCLREGIIEPPVLTWQDTLDVLRQCDQLRKEWNLIYPQETEK